MAENEKENIRVIGYSVLGSAIVFLIYDIMPFVVKNDLVTVSEKMLSFVIAIIIGILFIKAIPKIRHLSSLNYSVIVYAILGVCILLLVILYVDSLHHITIKTDWSSYASSEMITVSGEVNPVQPNETVLIQILYPNGELYNSSKASFIDDSNLYEYKFNIKPLGHDTKNTFIVKATYNGFTASTSFEYEDNRFPSLSLSP